MSELETKNKRFILNIESYEPGKVSVGFDVEDFNVQDILGATAHSIAYLVVEVEKEINTPAKEILDSLVAGVKEEIESVREGSNK